MNPIIEINFFDVVKKDITSGYIWPVGDDDFLIPQQAVDFINKINDKTTAESGMQFYDPAVKMQGRTRLPLKADNSGIIRQYKSGGRVKGCGIAKGGLGRAMKKGKK